MKANKKLLASAMALGLAGLTTVGSTYAWFSMNRTVSADGMKVQATTPASLAISTATPVGDATSVNFDSGATTLFAATHDAASDTLLKYVTNGQDVDAGTGLGNDLKYANATATDSEKHFVDYTVYIASSGGELANEKLSVKLFTSTEITASSMFNAITVDFYVNNTAVDNAKDNYSKSLNFKGATKDTAEGSKTLNKYVTTSVDIYTGKIAKSGETGYLTVTMRVYLDGALTVEGDDAKTYVRNNNVNTGEFTLGAQFTSSENK